MGLLAMSMFIASCSASHCVTPLDKTVRETLKLINKEARGVIKLTSKKVKCNEIDFHVGNNIIDSLTKTIKQFDTLIATSVRLSKRGSKEEILQFAERTNGPIQNTFTNLNSLHDLYDISTWSQFEMATFFTTDSFNISPEKIDEAKKAIEPVARRIVRFITDHPRQRLKAVIVCSGTPNNEVQNNKLFELRGRAVANLLLDQIKSNEEFIPNPKLIHYDIIWAGEKETSKSRRRKHSNAREVNLNKIMLNWHLFPASLYASSSDFR